MQITEAQRILTERYGYTFYGSDDFWFMTDQHGYPVPGTWRNADLIQNAELEVTIFTEIAEAASLPVGPHDRPEAAP